MFLKGALFMKTNKRLQKLLSVLLCVLMLALPLTIGAVAEHEHTWVAGEVTQEATCISTGKRIYTCTCGASEERTTPIAPTNHKGATQEVGETESSCTVRGYTAGVKCLDCGEFISGHKPKPMKEHSFTNFTYNNDGTCGVAGTETASCDYGCGTTKTQTAAGTAKQHDWSDWDVYQEATCTTRGMKKRVCANDESHVEVKEIPATGHVDEDGDGVCDVCFENLKGYRCPLCNKNEQINRSNKSNFVKVMFRPIHFYVHTLYFLFFGHL